MKKESLILGIIIGLLAGLLIGSLLFSQKSGRYQLYQETNIEGATGSSIMLDTQTGMYILFIADITNSTGSTDVLNSSGVINKNSFKEMLEYKTMLHENK